MPIIDHDDGEIVMRSTQVPGMMKALLKRWYFIVLGIIIGVVVATQLLRDGPSYESSITIAPSQAASSGDAASGTLSGLASLAGIGGGGAQTLSPYDQLLLTFKSAELANVLFANKPLLHKMFASRWDPVNRTWKINTSMSSAIARNIDESFGVRRPHDIGSDDVLTYLNNKIKIASDKITAVRVISLQTSDPRDSYDLVSTIFLEGDRLVRRSDSAFISGQVRYLEQRLNVITNAEHRQQLALILSDYEKRLMLAQGREDYAARVVDAPQVARSPASPRPVIVIMLGGFVGGILAVVIIAFLNFRRRAIDEFAANRLETV